MSWFARSGDISRARERGMVSDRGSGRSHTFHKRIEIVRSVEMGDSFGGGGAGIVGMVSFVY